MYDNLNTCTPYIPVKCADAPSDPHGILLVTQALAAD